MVKRYSGNLASRFIGCTYIKLKFHTTFYPAILDSISFQKKNRCLKTFISGPYFEALFWVCVRPTFCVPPLKMGGGTKSDDFGVCVSVPSQIFWSVPANGIKRVPFGIIFQF